MQNPDAPWQAWAVSSGLGVLAAILALVCMARDVPPRLAAVGFMLLVVIDLGLVDASLIEARPLESAFESPAILAAIPEDDLRAGRIFSPSYSLPQQVAAKEGLELADGVNPLQLASYREFMASASGFSTDAYSVTLPPFPSGDPSDDWSPQLDAQKLGLLNISWVVSANALEADGLELAQVVEGEHLYRNTAARPRAWIEDPESDGSAWTPAEILDWTPNRVVVSVTGPGRLVLSEIHYPGWRAELDGERVEIAAAYDVLRAVDLPPEDHEVVFSFHAWTVLSGSGLTLLTLLALGWLRWRK